MRYLWLPGQFIINKSIPTDTLSNVLSSISKIKLLVSYPFSLHLVNIIKYILPIFRNNLLTFNQLERMPSSWFTISNRIFKSLRKANMLVSSENSIKFKRKEKFSCHQYTIQIIKIKYGASRNIMGNITNTRDCIIIRNNLLSVS